MASKIMSGIEFWQKTELGKALAKRLPPKITRVIIDIGIEDPVKIYYSTFDTGPILNLRWDDVIEQFEVCEPTTQISPSEKTKTFTRILREKC